MENIVNIDYYDDVTSQDSSDESVYYSASNSPALPSYEEFDNYDYSSDTSSSSVYSGSSDESVYYSASNSPALPSYEEFDNYDYSSDTSSSSVYSGTFEPVNGQRIPTFYPAPLNWIEVLGIFPTEVRGTTYYQPLFYYVPVCSNLYCALPPDVESEHYESDNTEYYDTDSDTDYLSSSSDTYYTAEESEFYFNTDECDFEAEEAFYLKGEEKTIFECSVNNEPDLRDEMRLASESSENSYEEKNFDNVENQNEVNFKRRMSEYLRNYESNDDNGHCRSENTACICDEKCYKDTLPHAENTFEKKELKGVGDFNYEACNEIEYSSSGNLARSCDDNDFEHLASRSENSMIDKLEKTFKTKFIIDKKEENEVMISPYVISDSSADNITNKKVDKHHPLAIRDISEKREFSEKCSTNTFEFEYVNNKNCHKQGLKKFNSFEDLSGSKQEQCLKKHDSLEILSRFKNNEKYEKDFPCDDPEIGEDSYECKIESLSFDPDDFEFSEEEVKHMKDQIYLRALSGKLYQKTHIPSVAVLPTIYEEDEPFGETAEQQEDLYTSCLTEQRGVLNGSLCNLFEPSVENEEISKESQQKPKKKKMKRLREFLARIFCCVKPP